VEPAAAEVAAEVEDGGWLSVGFGGGALVALDAPESGHALWTAFEAGQGRWRVGAAVGVVYPGGRLQTRATLYGVTGRFVLAPLAPHLTLEGSALVGLVERDAAPSGEALPDGAPRWASSGSLLVAPAAGLRWTPATPGLALDLEARLVNLSHLGLLVGVSLAL
jgi:hypothetical protein